LSAYPAEIKAKAGEKQLAKMLDYILFLWDDSIGDKKPC